MAQQRYTIVLEDGKLKGVSLHDGDMKAQPLDLAALEAAVPSIAAATLIRTNELTDELAAKEFERTVEVSAKERIITAAKDPAVTEEEFQLIVTHEAQPKKDRDIAELEKQKTVLQAKIDALATAEAAEATKP